VRKEAHDIMVDFVTELHKLKPGEILAFGSVAQLNGIVRGLSSV
jgi:hypothetical protein